MINKIQVSNHKLLNKNPKKSVNDCSFASSKVNKTKTLACAIAMPVVLLTSPLSVNANGDQYETSKSSLELQLKSEDEYTPKKLFKQISSMIDKIREALELKKPMLLEAEPAPNPVPEEEPIIVLPPNPSYIIGNTEVPWTEVALPPGHEKYINNPYHCEDCASYYASSLGTKIESELPDISDETMTFVEPETEMMSVQEPILRLDESVVGIVPETESTKEIEKHLEELIAISKDVVQSAPASPEPLLEPLPVEEPVPVPEPEAEPIIEPTIIVIEAPQPDLE